MSVPGYSVSFMTCSLLWNQELGKKFLQEVLQKVPEVVPQNQAITLMASFCDTWSQSSGLKDGHQDGAYFVPHVGGYCLWAFISD